MLWYYFFNARAVIFVNMAVRPFMLANQTLRIRQILVVLEQTMQSLILSAIFKANVESLSGYGARIL